MNLSPTSYAEIIAVAIKGMADEERIHFFDRLLGYYCQYCGRLLKAGACQCENDE